MSMADRLRSSGRPTITDDEAEFLRSATSLGRLVTLQPDGLPHVVPVGWRYNEDLGTIDITGRNFAATKKFRNAAQDPRVAFIVDDVLPPWRPRAVMVQGHAKTWRPGPDDAAPEAMLRITPTKVVSWGLTSVT